MKKILLFFFVFFAFYTQNLFAQVLEQEVSGDSELPLTLILKGTQKNSDLSLFIHLVLENKKYIQYYVPLRYNSDSYAFSLYLRGSLADFILFLEQPKANFSTSEYSVSGNEVEVYFQDKDIASNNHLVSFEGSNLEAGVKFFFDDEFEYEIWKPDFVEKERNNSFLTNNPVEKKNKIFATLNGEKDKDFYSLQRKNTWEGVVIESIFFGSEIFSPMVKVYDKDLALIQQFLLPMPENEEQVLENFTKKNFVLEAKDLKNNDILYLEFSYDLTKRTRRSNKIINQSYIFTISK